MVVLPLAWSLMSMVRRCGVNDVGTVWYTEAVGLERGVQKPRVAETDVSPVCDWEELTMHCQSHECG